MVRFLRYVNQFQSFFILKYCKYEITSKYFWNINKMIVKNKCRINSRFMMNMILLNSLYVKLINTIITTSKGLSTARYVQLLKFRFMNNFSKLLFCILCFRMFVLIQIMQTRLQRTNFAVGNHEYKRWKEIIEVFFWYYICVVRLLHVFDTVAMYVQGTG